MLPPSLDLVLQVDGAKLRIKINSNTSLLTKTRAGSLGAAKRQLILDACRRQVDNNQAGFDPVNIAEHLVQLVGEQRSRESKFHIVRDLNRGIKVLHRDNGEHRSKDLFLRDRHLRRDFGKNGRLDEIALVVCRPAQPVASTEQPGTFPLSDVDI